MMSVESIFRRVDGFAGGRHATYRVEGPSRTEHAARRAFVVVACLLLVDTVIAAVAVAGGLWMLLHGGSLSVEVWLRTVVLLGMSVSLFYFLWRAWIGYWWAYSRLRLFTLVFPLVALSVAAIPGVYPGWLESEQIVFSLVLIVVGYLLGSTSVRAVFPRPHA